MAEGTKPIKSKRFNRANAWESNDGLSCALNYRLVPIFITPRRGDTTSGAGTLLERPDMLSNLPCAANQQGAVEIGMGGCSL